MEKLEGEGGCQERIASQLVLVTCMTARFQKVVHALLNESRLNAKHYPSTYIRNKLAQRH